MASSLFPNPMKNNGLIDAIQKIKSAAQGNPQALFDNMMQSNPQFKQFAESMQGKTPEEAFKQYGLDFNEIKGMFR